MLESVQKIFSLDGGLGEVACLHSGVIVRSEMIEDEFGAPRLHCGLVLGGFKGHGPGIARTQGIYEMPSRHSDRPVSAVADLRRSPDPEMLIGGCGRERVVSEFQEDAIEDGFLRTGHHSFVGSRDGVEECLSFACEFHAVISLMCVK